MARNEDFKFTKRATEDLDTQAILIKYMSISWLVGRSEECRNEILRFDFDELSDLIDSESRRTLVRTERLLGETETNFKEAYRFTVLLRKYLRAICQGLRDEHTLSMLRDQNGKLNERISELEEELKPEDVEEDSQ